MTVLTERLTPEAALSTAHASGTVEVLVDEELDISTLPRLRDRLEDAMRVSPARLIVDLRRCAFLDAQAMTVLLDVHRQAYRAGARLTLRGCSAQCLRLLSLAGLMGVFDVDDDEAQGSPPPRLAAS